MSSGSAAGEAQTCVRVLGPVSATVAGRPCAVSSRRMRALLGLLASDAGRVVPVDRVLAEVWGADADSSRTSSLHEAVSRLRRALGDRGVADAGTSPVRVLRRPPGYVLELPDGALDAERLERLVAAASRVVAEDPGSALSLLDEGLGLVRGEPLADVVDLLGPWAASRARSLADLVLRAREARVEALLGVGRAAEAAADADELLSRDPLRESAVALQLLALYRSGRQGAALAGYEELRRRLAEELGVDPGPALRRLHAQLLQHDPALDWRPVRPASAREVVGAVPGQRAPADATAAGSVGVQPDSPADAAPGHRSEQVAAVLSALDRVGQGRGEVWLVAGEAGIGKTRLAQQVAARARSLGMAVAVGRAQEVAQETPYWVWRGVLQDLPQLPRGGEVGVVLGASASSTAPALTRPALHEAVARALVRCAEAGPALLVVLEDVHWADEASTQLLAVLAERAAWAPLLLLCTWRSEGVSSSGPIGALAAALARTPATHRLHLTGLGLHEAQRVLAEELGEQPDLETAAAVTDRTGGNPFFLQEVARLVRGAPDRRAAWTAVPGTVRDVLLHRVAALPEPARRVLDVAAVHGRECELAQLEAVVGLPDDELDAAIAASVASGLVVEVSSTRPALRFRHALVREGLESQLGERARMRLHARAGAALARRPDADVDALAYHLLAGGDLADAATAVRAAVSAVDRATAQLALEYARDLLERALTCLARVPAGDERDRLELALQARYGTVVATLSGFAAPAAQAALERCQALALEVEPSPDVYAALYRRFLWLLMSGDYPGVRSFAEVLLRHAASRGVPVERDRFALLGHLARGSVLWCLGDASPAVDELELALGLAEGAGVGYAASAFGDPAVRVRMFLCHALASSGRREDAVAVAEAMVALARQSGPADESDALATRGMMHAAFGEPEPARLDGVEGRRLSRLVGAELLGYFAGLNEGWGTALTGSAEAGAREVRAAAEGYRRTGTRMHDPIVFTMLAEAEAAAGYPERAREAALEGLASLRRVGSRLWRERLEAAAERGSRTSHV